MSRALTAACLALAGALAWYLVALLFVGCTTILVNH